MIKILPFAFLFLISMSSSSQTRSPDSLETPPGGMSIQCEVQMYEEDILQFLKAERDKLVVAGILPAKQSMHRSKLTTLLEWPLRQVSGYSNPIYYSVVNHVDLDPTAGIQDYNCGDKSYDGHNGNDILIFPFWWDMMSANRVEVIAAAAGMIIAKQDGNSDMNCIEPGDPCSATWNAIYIEHADGSVAWYGHLKSGTLTSKLEGELVSTGEYLGIVGSSGCSSNPHLHLEIRDIDENVIEPFAGSCNATTASSWWVSQRDYWIPTINVLYTHDAAPHIDFCPETEATNFQNNFSAGDKVYYGIYISDQEDELTGSFEVRNSNGDVVHSWSESFEGQYQWAWWHFPYTLPMDAVPGVYTFEGTYNGNVTQHYFMVDCPQTIALDFETIRENIIYQATSSISTETAIVVYSAGGLSGFHAGDFIEINDQFTVTPGSQFEFRIGGCPTE